MATRSKRPPKQDKTSVKNRAELARARRYPAGSTIVRQGDRGDRFFLIERGSA